MWVQAEWKKHLVVEAQRGMVNSAVAADWNSDGKNDVIASLDGKVVLLLSPDWKSHTLHEFRAGLSVTNHAPLASIVAFWMLMVMVTKILLDLTIPFGWNA